MFQSPRSVIIYTVNYLWFSDVVYIKTCLWSVQVHQTLVRTHLKYDISELISNRYDLFGFVRGLD